MQLEGRNLQPNTRGDDVRRLQTELNQLGFNLGVNGFFDSMTYLAVREFQKKHGLEVNGIVDKRTARRINAEVDALDTPPFIVKGHIYQADGDPAVDVLISAFDVDLRSEQLLGETQTDRKGFYQIQYSTEQFSRREKDKADLVVKVLAANNNVLAASPISFNAPAVTEIDLTIPAPALRPLPLFDKIQRELAPLLANLRAEDLEENQEHQDLTFLSGETGFTKQILARFVLGHKLVPQGIQAQFWFVLLGSSFYEYTEEQSLAEQLTTILEALPDLNAAAVHKALIRGFNEKEIAETFQENVTQWIEEFLTLVARREVTATDNVTFVKAALEDAGIQSTEKQIKFVRLFNQYRTLTPELLEELTQDSSFTSAEIADLDTSFQLADLTSGDFSVVKMLKQEFSVRQPEQIRTLAKRSESEWVDLVSTKHADGEIQLPIEVGAIATDTQLPEAEIYGKTLERQFREAFPTTAFTGGLERALQNGGSQGLSRARDMSRFLNRHESFELLNTPVDEFLQEHIDPEFQELAEDETFKLEVKAVQRVFKLAPTFEATDSLLADNLHSAQKIYRLGESEFVRSYGNRPGFTRETARLAWNRAADTHAATLTIIADLKALEAEGLPLALNTGSDALSNFPNWNNLFKTGDLCECEHCWSVLSPAAYFADLLMFLRDRNSKKPKPGGGFYSVKDILFDRRPDLGFLELNCDNALVPLPYIDVVCEVLESAIDGAGENDLELVGFTTMPADPVTAQTVITDAFQTAFTHSNNDVKQKIELGSNFSLSPVETLPPDSWVVHTDDVTYLLKKKPPSANFFAEILRNTKASAAELRAYPQYVNPIVYNLLKTLRYPMSLPFDLFAEEVRAGFQKTNLQRWDLMGALRGTAAPNNPTDGDIAAEYFNISITTDSNLPPSPSEKNLILVAAADEQQEIWGETDANWLTTVGNVKNFLHKTHLEYNELLPLLDLRFINPTGSMVIEHLDASCDLDQKVIQGLNSNSLDRIHRFLRLWRKLQTWEMWELDLVIRHPRIGSGVLDETFLINLFYLSELKKKLGKKATVEQVCALFGDLNTETRFTKLHEKREVGLYQSLFLNRRLINPLNPAFELDPNTGDLPAGATATISHPENQPVVLAVLGIREADLILLKNLTKASDETPYINNNLTLTNLSFLWRHNWLAKTLKFKAEEWAIILKIFQQDIQEFTNPQAAWEFLEKIDHLKATGFKPDELNWLLAGDHTAKAAVKETDALRFLATLRQELQSIKAEYNPNQYDFLTVAPDADRLAVLLTSLLQQLNRDEEEVSAFLSILRGSVVLEAGVQGLPAGFAFPQSIATAPSHIPIEYDETNNLLRFTGLMSDVQQTTLLTSGALEAEVRENPAYQFAITDLFQQSQSAIANYSFASVEVALPGGVSLPSDRPSIPIRYSANSNQLSFIGVMTEAERDALIAAGNPADAILSLFNQPRLAVKFYERVFTAPLAKLPMVVDFTTQLPDELVSKITYDPERRLLHFSGIMSDAEQIALLALSNDAAYVTAVNSLATQPQTITLPDERIWLTDADLDATQPANDTEVKRLTNAIVKALDYLSKTLTENAIVQHSSIQLELTEAVTRRLLTQYPILPDTLLTHLSGNFALDTITLNGWYWANRVATLLKTWKITLAEWEKITALTTAAQLLDFQTLPLDDTGAIAPLDRFLRTSRLLKLRDSLPETEITSLEVLEKLNTGNYATTADFALDVERLNEDWNASDVEALVASLDLIYPADYLLAATWERLRRGFYFLDNLNAGADTVKRFASAAMGFEEAITLKELLRSKFGTETWLTLSAEIQDVLRERKRDALAAYLLTQPEPNDAPSGKWENTNDLYAYYLLDVEMSSCQLTSRLVQSSGSVQLFVQRCFMGLEPDVLVQANGDDGNSAWRWWKWMRKYRVWEANRKVFLWPENWIEPELKKDKSPFFKDLENELLQNEINQDNVEKAFINYLEKLDGVAQLEIAGFYQEDDGDNAIIHVFGRTTGAEPHLYYYRRYDYRQWTPWEKVDLDIQGDYLIPAVVNKRLFLFWPVFTEVPDEEGNNMVTVPKLDTEKESEFDASQNKTRKRLRLQLAVSDYRQGKWSAKKVSTDFYQSQSYTNEIDKKHYSFYPVDLTAIAGNFVIGFDGFSISQGNATAQLRGGFNISGCKGVPEKTSFRQSFNHVIRPERDSVGIPVGGPVAHITALMKWVESQSRYDVNDFAFQNVFGPPVLEETPGLFKVSPPWHMSYFDKLFLNGQLALFFGDRRISLLGGSWLPFFYNDQRRTFFILPCFWPSFWQRGRGNVTSIATLSKNEARSYYPEIKNFIRHWEDTFEGQIREWLKDVVPELTNTERTQWEQFFHQQLDEEAMPPYTDEQFKALATRWLMRFFHLYLGTLSLLAFQFRHFHFKNFYHPFVCDFAKLVYNPLQGIPALMSRETQLKNTGFRFKQHYQPTHWVIEPTSEDFYPQEVVDFTPDGAYSPYNWELFFHIPLLIANSLSKNQRFEEARDWYHFIFNPIGVESGVPEASPMSKYWITKPFFATTDPEYNQQRIENLLRMLAGDTSVSGTVTQDELIKQVEDWRTNPFEPHRIANYRTVAYQKTVVMKYLDNLIAWGDYLFRQDTMESINEATQLYILAAEILGPRPKKVSPQAKPPLESFNELENELETEFDAFSNALVEVENLIPVLPGNGSVGVDSAPLPMLYFCIPQNDKMLGYWDTVADRLYKIRNCMNIEGVVRQLALFEPPIDPGALVKAVAGGVDISSALADLNAPLPLYRFNVLLQKANEVCNDVKALGSALLTALEKKDAEALSLLRQGQEIRLLEAVKSVREKQIEEAKENLEGLKRSKTVIEERRNYYRDIEERTAQEQLQLDKLSEAHTFQEAAQGVKLAASIISIFPAIDLGASGFGGSPLAKFKIGGLELGQAANLAAEVLSFLSLMASNDSAMASSEASFERRWDDWKLQEHLADKELSQIDKQIDAAELRISITEKELENHIIQIENTKATDEFMRSKYTNEELYQWQIGQISGVYFQSYKLAYDLAKRAERCFRFELGVQDSSYINFGYWDSLKKGLLSGEKLQYDLHRLENAYLEQNRREFELTKHISLALLDPLALIQLRETGRCFVNLPEEIFDLDYPGHYFRRIKSVSITLPCVVGPYTTISCTLRLLKNNIRINTSMPDGYPRNTDDAGLPTTDDRFIENNIPVKAIAASNAQNDSGIFELNFRDERYLPFEGAGVISQWSLELFNDNSEDFGKSLRQFDYSTITDTILHIKYMAREDAGTFKNSANAHLREYFSQDEATPSLRMFNLRQEFPSQWHRFLNPTNPEDGNVFELEISQNLFPIRDHDKTLKVNTIWLLARCTNAENYEVVMTPPLPEPPPDDSNTMTLARVNQYGGLHFSQKDVAALGIEILPTANPSVKWQLKMTRPGGGNLQEDLVKKVIEVEDLLLVLGYEWG